jgi:hypothetical protein
MHSAQPKSSGRCQPGVGVTTMRDMANSCFAASEMVSPLAWYRAALLLAGW